MPKSSWRLSLRSFRTKKGGNLVQPMYFPAPMLRTVRLLAQYWHPVGSCISSRGLLQSSNGNSCPYGPQPTVEDLDSPTRPAQTQAKDAVAAGIGAAATAVTALAVLRWWLLHEKLHTEGLIYMDPASRMPLVGAFSRAARPWAFHLTKSRWSWTHRTLSSFAALTNCLAFHLLISLFYEHVRIAIVVSSVTELLVRWTSIASVAIWSYVVVL